jgi:hypothetical protein
MPHPLAICVLLYLSIAQEGQFRLARWRIKMAKNRANKGAGKRIALKKGKKLRPVDPKLIIVVCADAQPS